MMIPRKMILVGFITASVCLVASILAIQARKPAAEAVLRTCLRADIRPSLVWPITGTWRGEGEQERLVLRDSTELRGLVPSELRASLFALPRELSIKDIASCVLSPPFEEASTAIPKSPSEDTRRGFEIPEVRLARLLKPAPKSRGPLDQHHAVGTGEIRRLFKSSSIDGEDFLAFGEVQREDAIQSAFIYLQPEADRGWEVQLPDDSSVEQAWYEMPGFSSIAVLNNEAYVLLQGKEPQIARLSDDLMHLEHFAQLPAGYDRPFELRRPPEEMADYQRRTAVLEEIQRSSMVIGIFSQRDQLYMLAKSQSRTQAAETTWSLIGVDLETRTLSSGKRLPTRAPHLSVIASNRSDSWAFAEMGAAQRIGPNEAAFLQSESLFVVQESSIGRTCTEADEMTVLTARLGDLKKAVVARSNTVKRYAHVEIH